MATAFFSFLNFALTGYYLTNEVSSNPNVTVSQSSWLQKMPSFMTDKVRPVCQPALLAPQNAIFTNQTALTYTIEGITSIKNQDVLSSLEYYNNVVERCSIDSIDIDMQSNDRLANQIGFTAWGQVVKTHLSCNISTTQGVISINLTQAYDYVPESVSLRGLGAFLGSGVLNRNESNKAALWWGESLMSWYWLALAWNLELIANADASANRWQIRKGILSFTPTNRTNDPTSQDFFDVDYRYLSLDDGVISPGIYKNNFSETHSIAQLDRHSACPNVWAFADGLAKSAYFSVLTDLGQWRVGSNATHLVGGQQQSKANILTDSALLQLFSANITEFEKYNLKANAMPGPATNAYDPSNTRFRNQVLNASASTISVSYLCQVPRMKSIGNVIVSVFVADLVFLQAFWTLFTFVVDTWVLKDDDYPSSGTDPSGTDPTESGLASLVRGPRSGTSYTSLETTQGDELFDMSKKPPSFRHLDSSQGVSLHEIQPLDGKRSYLPPR